MLWRLALRFLILLLLGLSGCATFKTGDAKILTRDELVTLSHNDTTDCLWYEGSDEEFHYIFRSEIIRKSTGSEGWYRIPVADLPLNETFAFGKGSYPLFTPMILDNAVNPGQRSP